MSQDIPDIFSENYHKLVSKIILMLGRISLYEKKKLEKWEERKKNFKSGPHAIEYISDEDEMEFEEDEKEIEAELK